MKAPHAARRDSVGDRTARRVVLAAVVSGTGLLLAPNDAHGQMLGRLSLHAEFGAGSLLSGRQQDQLGYGLGLEGTLRGSLRLVGPLAVQLSLGHWAYPSDQGQGYVTAFTAGLRMEGRANRHVWFFADANVGPVVTGGDTRTGLDAAVGFEFAVSPGFSIGPFGRAGMVLASTGDAPSNAVTLIAGLSGTVHFADPPPRPPTVVTPHVTVPDSDGDGLDDATDRCPTEVPGPHPDTAHPGCPLPDADHDGIPDASDRCPNEVPGEHPDPDRQGCPDGDRDHDGVLDHADLCPDLPQGRVGIEGRPGCPAPDHDGDAIPDPVDHCPDTPGAPSGDPTLNGCPALATLVGDEIRVDHPVEFTANDEGISPDSAPLLQSVADVILANPTASKGV